ncbi:MAG: acetyl-CoA carboxylase biotin carboxyl carrier protein [Gammaproteobacteria bacterium]|nr:acetyl-CoA carboxylase biotin carboxyl carrier protein [Gammaproteobacteria bacterium]
MDIRKIKKLIDLVNANGIAKLEIKEAEESVCITSGCCQHISETHQPIIKQQTPTTSVQNETKTETIKEEPTGHQVKAPMVGTAYLSPAPGAKPFVEIGQRVQAGDTICLIEAMKMFNQVEADKGGVISACLIENGSPVEYDQPLFIIE